MSKTVTLKELREFKHRVNPEERQGAYGYYFIRPFSIYLTYLAVRFGLSANQVTVLQTISGIAGAACLAFPDPLFTIAAILLLQLGFVLDNVDGEVARFRRQASITGKLLDSIGHEFVVPSMYFALGIGTYLRTDHFESIIFAFLAGLCSLRFDISSMYREAGQLIESKHDNSYDYYANFERHGSENLFRRKNEDSPIRMLYALFAYPAVMNIISCFLLADLFISPFVFMGYKLSLAYFFLVTYGTLLPIRRIMTIRILVIRREAEGKYLALIDAIRSSTANSEKTMTS